jgi:hypothetical protein
MTDHNGYLEMHTHLLDIAIMVVVFGACSFVLARTVEETNRPRIGPNGRDDPHRRSDPAGVDSLGDGPCTVT